MYLMPEQPEHRGRRLPDLPEVVNGNVLFGLTSWNPKGQDVPLEQNLASYQAIEKDLRALSPAHMWQSFGFDASGYRENGFTLAFPEGDAAAARAGVVSIAEKYGQGAIYEFRVVAGEPWRIVRSTVPVLVDGVDADVVMVACRKPDLPNADPDLYFEGAGGRRP